MLTGRTKIVPAALARVLVRQGRFGYVTADVRGDDSPPGSAPGEQVDEASFGADVDYGSLDYNDLRRIASEQGVEVDGRKKEDYVRALTYQRRDMRAE